MPQADATDHGHTPMPPDHGPGEFHSASTSAAPSMTQRGHHHSVQPSA